MDTLISAINFEVPRSRYHVSWRLALHLRYGTSKINSASRSVYTWSELFEVFLQGKNAAVFRYATLVRK
jgi:hypothetical protein